ncbi:hypothetical protein V6N11_056287 [Hibiscus sabdariffa]|uniref:Uncharacterized protein n=1 Tax=Hibiscus sabdariffa TaxID=183260 RepID=A0ABR2T482_9ROSI
MCAMGSGPICSEIIITWAGDFHFRAVDHYTAMIHLILWTVLLSGPQWASWTFYSPGSFSPGPFVFIWAIFADPIYSPTCMASALGAF